MAVSIAVEAKNSILVWGVSTVVPLLPGGFKTTAIPFLSSNMVSALTPLGNSNRRNPGLKRKIALEPILAKEPSLNKSSARDLVLVCSASKGLSISAFFAARGCFSLRSKTT